MKKRFSEEQIIGFLKEADALIHCPRARGLFGKF